MEFVRGRIESVGVTSFPLEDRPLRRVVPDKVRRMLSRLVAILRQVVRQLDHPLPRLGLRRATCRCCPGPTACYVVHMGLLMVATNK